MKSKDLKLRQDLGSEMFFVQKKRFSETPPQRLRSAKRAIQRARGRARGHVQVTDERYFVALADVFESELEHVVDEGHGRYE